MNKITTAQVRFLLKFFLMLLFTISINAQVGQQWVKRYNGTGNGNDESDIVLVERYSGNTYVTGRSLTAIRGTLNQDIVTIKYNSAGVQQWVRSYNGTANGADDPVDMVFDLLGNLVVTGTSAGVNSQQDCITIKYDINGNLMWVKRYNGTANGHDYSSSIIADLEGGVIITGKSRGMLSSVNTYDDIITIKYNYYGNEEWVQRYNGISNSYDEAFSITSDAFNSVYITGYSRSSLSGADFITVKYSSVGNLEWIRKVVSDLSDVGYKILNNYQASEIYSIGKSGTYTFIECYNYAGNLKWEASDYGALNILSSATVDNLGTIYLCGPTTVNGNINYMLIAYNSSIGGGLSWYETYDGVGSGEDYPTEVTTDNFNNVYITGYSTGAGSGIDYATLKYNISGIKQWEIRYNYTGTGTNMPVSITAGNNGDVYVTGFSQNPSGNFDYATIKYNSQGAPLRRNVTEIPDEFRLYQNYPNPFNPSTNLKYDIPNAGNIKIAVYDMLGKEVQIITNEFKEAGIYEISFDGSNLPSGTYFYRLTSGNYTEIKKMILLK